MGEPDRSEPPSRRFPEITFPDVPRLRLEAVVAELTDRANEVLLAEGRLRALLRAHAAVASDLSVESVLSHIVLEARQLVGARYAALGVVGVDGDLREFHHAGMDAETVARIGALPRGRGVLGWLVAHPETVRVARIEDHPAAAGFPAGHPPMGSFLGVPITVAGRAFGNLYLADAAAREFTEEDEQLIVALAASAGAAIENARLYEEAERRHRWQVAATEMSQQLFGSFPDTVWDIVLKHAQNASEGDGAFAAELPDGLPPALRVVAVDGAEAAGLLDRELALAGAAADRLLRERAPVLLSDAGQVREQLPEMPGRVASVTLAPVLRGQRVAGVMGVVRAAARTLTSRDAEQLARFAVHVGIAWELAAARSDGERVRLLDDHERIATRLNDEVITDLFAAGMTLEGMIPFLRETDRKRLAEAVDAIDRSIGRIRSAVFRSPGGAGGT